MTPTILRSPERQKEGYECMYVIFSMYACEEGFGMLVCVCVFAMFSFIMLALLLLLLFYLGNVPGIMADIGGVQNIATIRQTNGLS